MVGGHHNIRNCILKRVTELGMVRTTALNEVRKFKVEALP